MKCQTMLQAFLCFFCIGCFSTFSHAQQWEGPNNSTDTISRNGHIQLNSRKLLLGPMQSLYGNNNSALYYNSNHSSLAQLIFRDRENEVLGKIYGSGNGLNFGLMDADGNWSMLARKDVYTQFRINNAERFFIGNNYSRVRNQYGYIQFGTQNTSYAYFATDLPRFQLNKELRVSTGLIGSYNSDLQLTTNGTARITVDKDNGNVGIGMAPSSYKLDVAGDINARRVQAGEFYSRGENYLSQVETERATISDLRLSSLGNHLGRQMLTVDGSGNVDKQAIPTDINNVSLNTGLSGAYLGGNLTAINAETNSPIWNANKLNGHTISSETPTTGDVLTWDHRLNFWRPLRGTNGDITGVMAGTGLSGGGTTGTVTLNAQTGTALWNANKLQGRSISSIAPGNGEVLRWDGSNWKPKDLRDEFGIWTNSALDGPGIIYDTGGGWHDNYDDPTVYIGLNSTTINPPSNGSRAKFPKVSISNNNDEMISFRRRLGPGNQENSMPDFIWSLNVGYGDGAFALKRRGFNRNTYNETYDHVAMRIIPEGRPFVPFNNPNNSRLHNVEFPFSKLYASEIEVNVRGQGDFVFEQDYNLPELTEVEDFIKTNKHLPEIPKASETGVNAWPVGEMSNKLLIKIEELTLYTIDQEKQIDSMKGEIEALKVMVKALAEK